MILVVELASGRVLKISDGEAQGRFKNHLDDGYSFVTVDTDARRETVNRQGIVTFWYEEPAPPAVETAPTVEATPKPARSFIGRVARLVLGGKQA